MIKLIRKAGSRENLSVLLREYKTIFDELRGTESGILLKANRILIPNALRDRVVEIAHIANQGVVKTKALIRLRVWFSGIEKRVEERVNTCRECYANVGKPDFEPLKPSKMPAGLWQEVSADFYALIATVKYWFVNHCDFSRWISVKEISTVAFPTVANHLTKLFSTLEVPLIYKTDNGSPFQSGDFAQFAKQWGFSHRKISPEWPLANAEAEATMKKLAR